MNKKFLIIYSLFFSTFLCAMQPGPAARDLAIPFPVTCTFADGQELVLTSEQASSLQSEFLYTVVHGPFQEGLSHTIDFSGSPVTKDILMCLLDRYLSERDNPRMLDEKPGIGWLLAPAADYLVLPQDRIHALALLAVQKPEILKTFGLQDQHSREASACAILPNNKFVVFTGYGLDGQFMHIFTVPKLPLPQKLAVFAQKVRLHQMGR